MPITGRPCAMASSSDWPTGSTHRWVSSGPEGRGNQGSARPIRASDVAFHRASGLAIRYPTSRRGASSSCCAGPGADDGQAPVASQARGGAEQNVDPAFRHQPPDEPDVESGTRHARTTLNRDGHPMHGNDRVGQGGPLAEHLVECESIDAYQARSLTRGRVLAAGDRRNPAPAAHCCSPRVRPGS